MAKSGTGASTFVEERPRIAATEPRASDQSSTPSNPCTFLYVLFRATRGSRCPRLLPVTAAVIGSASGIADGLPDAESNPECLSRLRDSSLPEAVDARSRALLVWVV